MIHASIKIYTEGSIFTSDWDSEDEIDLKQYLQEICYEYVNTNQKAMIDVETTETGQQELVYSSNTPDGCYWESGETEIIDNLVFLYDDTTETLKLIGSNNKTKKYEQPR